MTATRRLTSILSADVAGYSRLMGADEEGTHGRLRAHFRKLIEPKTAAGRCADKTDRLDDHDQQSRLCVRFILPRVLCTF
jgi:class 3 adenylate cyclase